MALWRLTMTRKCTKIAVLRRRRFDSPHLTVYNDGTERKNNPQNICIAFTVEDVDAEFEKLTALGIEIVSPPTLRPWGAKNMSFLDPDGNLITFRSFPKQ